jgi:hypothetical protein
MARAHIYVRSCDIEIDQVTGLDGSRAHDLVGLSFTVDTLEGWIKSQHLCDIALQPSSIGLCQEGLSDISLLEEDVEHEGEGYEIKGMTSALGDWWDLTKHSHPEQVQQKRRP